MISNISQSEWKIFIDGVEIPWQSFSIVSSLDAETRAQIHIEPHRLLTQVRPDCIVHIFRRDPFVSDSTNDTLSQYKLVLECATVGTTYQKTDNTRYVTVDCAGLLTYMSRTLAFMTGLGLIPFTSEVSGSSTIFIPQITELSIVNTSQIADNVSQPTESTGFTQRVLDSMKKLSDKSPIFAQMAQRSRLFDKFSTMPDDLVETFFNNVLVLRVLMGKAETVLTQQSTLLDVFLHFLSYGMCHLVSPLLPKPNTTQRNDFCVVPELFYHLPPACNIVLPHMIDTLSVTRDFQSEATRAFIRDPFINVYHVAPASIRKDQPTTSNPAVKDYTKFQDSELEKGIVPSVGTSDFAYFSASALIQQFSSSNWAQTAVVEESYGSEQGQLYGAVMQSAADSVLSLAKYERQANVRLIGTHLMLPGFPVLVCDSEMSYFARLDTVSISVTAFAGQSTGLGLSKVRPVPNISAKQYVQIKSDLKKIENSAVSAIQDFLPRGEDINDKADTAALIAIAEVLKSVSDFKDRVTDKSTESIFKQPKEAMDFTKRLTADLIGLGSVLEAFVSGLNSFQNELSEAELEVLNDMSRLTEGTALGGPQKPLATDQGKKIEQLAFQIGQLSSATATSGLSIFKQISSGIANTLEAGIIIVDKPQINIKLIEDKLFKVLDLSIEVLSTFDILWRIAVESDRREAVETAAVPLVGVINSLSDLEDKYDIPLVPAMAAGTYGDLKTYEDTLVSLFGVKRIYPTVSSQLDKSLNRFPIIKKKIEFYYSYLEGLRALNGIYPIIEKGVSLWERWLESKADVARQSHTTLYKRSGQSLTDFVKKNDLNIQTVNSSSPIPSQFIVLEVRPQVQSKVRNVDNIDLVWDDSIFTKLVNIQTGNIFAIPAIVSIIPASAVQTSLIENRRKSVTNPFLTSLVRQAFWIQYAIAVTGSRGRDGT